MGCYPDLYNHLFGEVHYMKAVSYVSILLPTAFFGLYIACQHEPVASTLVGSLWLVATVFCLGWGLYIRRRHRVLAWVCGAVGVLHVGLLVLPAFVPAKTKVSNASPQPNHRAGVDAGLARLSSLGSHWPGTTQHGRWSR